MAITNQHQYRVTIFGSSRPIPGDLDYELALELGAKLASLGFTVLTGGYIGTMEAVSKGAHINGGHVIGVTCDEIEQYRPIGPNEWIHEEHRTSTLHERISILIDHTDACLALPGGVGTLTEILSTWNHLLIGAIKPKPLILIGLVWKNVFKGILDPLSEFIPINHRNLLDFALDNKEAIEMLGNYYNNG